MKNSVSVLLSLTLVLFVAMGCSLGGLTGGSDTDTAKESAENTGKATEKAPSGEKIEIGIAECDELATYINDNSEALEGNIIAKGIMLYIKNRVLGDLKDSVKKMSDEEKTKAAEACKKALTQLKETMK